MFNYIVKRLVYFIPTLFLISLIAFGLSQVAPGDPVELKLQGGMGAASGGQLAEKLAGEKAYLETSEKLGLNLPVFYFDLTTAAFPDTLYKIPKKSDRKNLSALIGKYGNWPQVESYYHNLKKLDYATATVVSDSTNYGRLKLVRENAAELLKSSTDVKISRLLGEMDSAIHVISKIRIDSVTVIEKNTLEALIPQFNTLNDAYNAVKSEATPYKQYIPAIHFYGMNQYHRWIFGDVPWFANLRGVEVDPALSSKGFLRFDFGYSYLDGRAVKGIILDALKWSLLMNLIVVFLIYLGSIPIGVQSAVKKDSFADRFSTVILFILYSLPSFWIATMLVVFLTTDDYGMNWFPTYGLGKLGEDYGFWEKAIDRAYHLILPCVCMIYGGFAFLSRQMRGGMLNVIKQDYIRTARAKGLSEGVIIWKHAFRNSLIPVITIFASLFPLMISGSIVIEYIFQIPGMGQVGFGAVVARNYPVLFTVLMFSAILTVIGVLISDILYAVVDPRISFSKKS